MGLLFSSFLVIVLFTGCSNPLGGSSSSFVPHDYNDYKSAILSDSRNADYTKPYPSRDTIYQNLNGAIVAIADQLLTTNVKKQKKTRIILTAFVQLEKFTNTSPFGRVISESLFNELHVRKFRVVDFRGQDAVVINSQGEFHLTRNIQKLKKEVGTADYIVVGTYSKFENETMVINARIMDSLNGEVISTARIIYKSQNCAMFNICKKRRTGGGIKIIADDCAQIKDCPKQQCKSGVCGNLNLK
jgi:TolB-like protein